MSQSLRAPLVRAAADEAVPVITLAQRDVIETRTSGFTSSAVSLVFGTMELSTLQSSTTQPNVPSITTSSSSDGKNLDRGTIAGICFGVVVVVFLLGVGAFSLYRRHHKARHRRSRLKKTIGAPHFVHSTTLKA